MRKKEELKADPSITVLMEFNQGREAENDHLSECMCMYLSCMCISMYMLEC